MQVQVSARQEIVFDTQPQHRLQMPPQHRRRAPGAVFIVTASIACSVAYLCSFFTFLLTARYTTTTPRVQIPARRQLMRSRSSASSLISSSTLARVSSASRCTSPTSTWATCTVGVVDVVLHIHLLAGPASASARMCRPESRVAAEDPTCAALFGLMLVCSRRDYEASQAGPPASPDRASPCANPPHVQAAR